MRAPGRQQTYLEKLNGKWELQHLSSRNLIISITHDFLVAGQSSDSSKKKNTLVEVAILKSSSFWAGSAVSS